MAKAEAAPATRHREARTPWEKVSHKGLFETPRIIKPLHCKSGHEAPLACQVEFYVRIPEIHQEDGFHG